MRMYKLPKIFINHQVPYHEAYNLALSVSYALTSVTRRHPFVHRFSAAAVLAVSLFHARISSVHPTLVMQQ